MEEASQPHHILMLPFMAQGHLIRFLELALKIIHHNPKFTITILATPLNINSLRSAVASRPSTSSQLRLTSLPFDSSVHGLPPNSENTQGLAPHQVLKLVHASTALETPLRRYISATIAANGRPPVCIISDMFMGWANGVAKSFGTVNYSFGPGAYGTAAYASICLNLPHRNLVNGGCYDEFCVPGFPESCRFKTERLNPLIRGADGEDEWSRHWDCKF